MDFRELEYFDVISQERNLSRAAQKLYVGQPTLSKYVQRLEKELGLKLFSRSGKRLDLTYAGERYLSYVRQLRALQHQMENEMTDIRVMNKGTLRVGINPVRCSIILPQFLPLFRQQYPNVDLLVTEDSSAKLDMLLEEGKIDMALFHLSEPWKEFVYDVIVEDRIYAITQKNHPIRSRAVPDSQGAPGIRLEWLSNEVLLLQSLSQRQGQYMRHVLQEKDIHPKSLQEQTNIRAAVTLAANGYGVTFLSSSLMSYFLRILEFDCYTLLDVDTPIRFVAARRRGAYVPSCGRDLVRMVKNLYEPAKPQASAHSSSSVSSPLATMLVGPDR